MPTPSSATSTPSRRIVVVGGVAGGMSAAARARRLDEDASIVVLEQSPYVSFANCGLPYHLSGEIERRDDLLLHTPESLAASLALDVRTRSRVTTIDRQARTVTVASTDGEYDLPYDALLLAPGAVAVRPPVDGLDHPAVHTLRTIPDLDALVARLAMRPQDAPGRAVVVGAGFIGLEAVEALTARGLQVDLVELADHVLPPLDPELAPLLADELRSHGVGLHLGTSARDVAPADDGTALVTLSDGTRLAADVVVVTVGVRPASDLARAAGLALGPTGAIRVDHDQRTSDPHVFAVGDAVEVTHAVTARTGPVPLAGPANRQGRRAADAMVGRRTTPQAPVLGTAIVRVFGLTAAVTGASQAALVQAAIPHEVVRLHGGHHAGYFPGAEQVHLVASFAPDGRLLGAQAVGREGVDKRIDVLATALRAGMTADDLAELELAYAPPYGSAKDPVNMLGFVAQNVLDGTLPQWHAPDADAVLASSLVLDVRSRAEFDRGHLDGALNVPHTELRARLDEVRAAADGRPVAVHCASGVRSYLATRVLLQSGTDARNLSGGWLTLAAVRPDLVRVPATAGA
ncbi:FAD-dependent oxidoreductase [Cellulomonas fimi]|uniref:FAD-dependent pyridine nucleotide-disulfide oxidoreductase n=1 Tax=Cellulomonas fimi (strain ATCC 484 / DSM 20113 / JCM 1341 / CCUG 24087 / LMG 16345 / NBRC 15513 / NCIMB 8980 / NCTC 7547 / NRS-133) TaxID=590998 RepID=F4H2R3_CELFA|nr:FAD-dependent oxidoreductase [Cellulomonas fimi]AEE46412.1 FAD-dependent pyridine nucleotide-disulfide oxidoreductase [Cellulomonas fimi ATCC 484]NNH08703.1 FAD-dependent oxidoreductase [Cellulomonas fimi]VEH32893.1 Coenzyme A disulfide reductase [Cellulomonas fimi]